MKIVPRLTTVYRPAHILLGVILMTLLTKACDSQTRGQKAAEQLRSYRFATFNIAMGLPESGAMAAALESGDDPRLSAVAAILQTVRPDVVLLNEFDFDLTVDAGDLLNRNYLEQAEAGRLPVSYAYSFRPPVNTGIASGLDVDVDGVGGEPEDAWGFGRFPGQYGMLILSKFPIREDRVRSFRTFRWSQLPAALRPRNEDGSPFHPDATWQALRLSSKNHVDVPIDVDGLTVHLLASHPTPPGFDGPENLNGKRNHDELAFWRHYLLEPDATWIVDDAGHAGGLEDGPAFVVAGDLNADPADGGSIPGAIAQLLDQPAIDSSCVPRSEGGAETAAVQAGVNRDHRGDPAADTADFNDKTVGNLRVDYVLPSRDLEPIACGVFWPVSSNPLHGAAVVSDHRLVWVDIRP